MRKTMNSPSEKIVKDIKRATRKHYSSEGKIRIVLENYVLPGDLDPQIKAFVDHYNHQRYHESLGNVTPADVYFGRDTAILWKKWKGSNKRRLKRDACITKNAPHDHTKQISQTLS